MISLDTITVKNFLSIGAQPLTVALNAAPLTLVMGANGCGKSTILQAISYVLFGEPLTKIRQDNLINDINLKEMRVSIDFRSDNIAYRIERGRKPNVLHFFVGGSKVDLAQGENRRTQIDIERVLGMSHMMFCHVVALNTFTTPFLKMRPAEQREVIEELMGITLLSQLAEQLKQTMDANRESLRNEEARIKAVGDANARIEQAITAARVDAAVWDQKQTRILTDLGARFDRLNEVDIDAELRVFDAIEDWKQAFHALDLERKTLNGGLTALTPTLERLRAEVVRYRAEARTDGATDIDRLRQRLDRLRSDLEKTPDREIDRFKSQTLHRQQAIVVYQQDIQRLRSELASVEQQIASPDHQQCSTCGQGLHGTEHLTTVLHNLAGNREHLNNDIARLLSAVAQAETDLAAIERDCETLRHTHRDNQAVYQQQIIETEAEIIVLTDRLAENQLQAAARVARGEAELEQLRQQQRATEDALAMVHQAIATLGVSPQSQWDSRGAVRQMQQDRDRLAAQIETEIDRSNPVTSQIDRLAATLSVIDYTSLNDIASQLKHEQFLYKLLTAKDSFIRKRIIDQNLHFLNHSLNRYLGRLELPHAVRFLPDLSVDITLMGRELDFEQLSRGEMNRVILATSWAFRDLWENLNTAVNLMFADEVLDLGTDDQGVEAGASVLMQIAVERNKNIFLISHHHTLRSRIDRVMVARKVDQFTEYETDEG